MLTKKQLRFLRRLFPGDGCALDPCRTHAFTSDASRLPGSCPAAVRPESEEQVCELMAWAQAEGVAIVPRGRGTAVVGSALARGAVSVSMLRMNRIKDISAGDFAAVAEPGVVTGDLARACEAEGLFYPPDPASVNISTIGGNVATNAGGMRAVKYGVTRDWVLGLRAVLPGGEVIATGGRAHKNVAGLDLTRLLVGSEGTLALTTEVTVKLIPLPEGSASLLACFTGLDHCLEGAARVFAAGFLPAAMEFMDADVLSALARVADTPWPKGSGAALLFKLTGGAESVAHDVRRLAEVLAPVAPTFLEHGVGAEQEEPLWELRRRVSPALYQLAPDKIADDIAVPRSAIRRAVEGFKAIGAELGLTVVCFGHLGDGNIHVDFLYDARVPGEKLRAEEAKKRQLKLTLELGGTITGEHGVGLTKLPYLGWQIGETERGLMRSIKAVFDPKNIMNPGKAY